MSERDPKWHETSEAVAQAQADESFRRFILAKMRFLRARAKYHVDQIDLIGVMLMNFQITPEDAIAMVEEIDDYEQPHRKAARAGAGWQAGEPPPATTDQTTNGGEQAPGADADHGDLAKPPAG